MGRSTVRIATDKDVGKCGRITHLAFDVVNEEHGFENTDFLTIKIGCQVAEFYTNKALHYSDVGEFARCVVECGVLDERSRIRGVATVSASPEIQGNTNIQYGE